MVFFTFKFSKIYATFSFLEKEMLIIKHVLTLLPICNSDISTDLPFSVSTIATDGKQPPPPLDDDDGGGGGGGGT